MKTWFVMAFLASSSLAPASPKEFCAQCSDAELLAIELTGELIPPSDQTDQIAADLAAIRICNSFFECIHVLPAWMPSELLIRLTPDALIEFEAGNYHGLDSLNEQYGPVEIERIGSTDLFLFTFAACYNPTRLALLYSAAIGVLHAGQHFFGGGGPDIRILEVGHYKFIYGWEDCPMGCLFWHVWEFRVENGTVELIQEYGDPMAIVPSSWGDIKSSFR